MLPQRLISRLTTIPAMLRTTTAGAAVRPIPARVSAIAVRSYKTPTGPVDNIKMFWKGYKDSSFDERVSARMVVGVGCGAITAFTVNTYWAATDKYFYGDEIIVITGACLFFGGIIGALGLHVITVGALFGVPLYTHYVVSKD